MRYAVYKGPLLYAAGFVIGASGFMASESIPRLSYPQSMRFMVSVLMTALLLLITVCWTCLIKWLWGQSGGIMFQDKFDQMHPAMVIALAVFSLFVCTMTFYWETRDPGDTSWPLSRVVFRAVTIMIPAFIFSNGF